jgi:tetratricopeptide (TPR) repeat protein
MVDFTSHEAPAHEPAALPVMLPAKLIGRDAILNVAYPELKQNRVVLLHGEAGVGKTALAGMLASAFAQQNPGGVLWLSVEGDSLAQLVVRVARAMGDITIANAENPLALVAALSALLSQQKPMIVLDGDPLFPAVSEFINRVGANLPILIVATEDEPSSQWKSISVLPLADADAATLFSEKSGLTGAEIPQIVRLLGGLPLPLTVAAGTARITKMTAPQVLAALTAATGTPSNRALSVGYSAIQQGLQGLLLMLGASFDGRASLELLHKVSGAPADSIEKVMGILAAAGFITLEKRYGEALYGLHPEAHSYSQNYLKSAGRLVVLQEKYRDTLIEIAKLYSTPAPEAHNKLAALMDTFLAVAHWASERGESDVSSQLVVALTQAGNFISGRGYRYELLQLREAGSSGLSAFPANPSLLTAAQMAAPSATDDDDDIPNEDFEDDDDDFLDDFLNDDDDDDIPSPEDMIAAPLNVNDPDSLRIAIADARAKGNPARALELQETVGALLVKQGKHDEALGIYNELLLTHEESDNNRKILDTLLALAPLMVKLESPQAAILNATRGARLADELKDSRAHMQMQIVLGDARQQLGESTEAIMAYSGALTTAKSLADREAEADVLMKLGFAQLDDDQSEIAIQTWNAALALCKSLGKRDCEGRVLGGLGTAYGELERWQEAINYHASALYIAREVKDRKEEALQLNNLGYANKQAGKLGESLLRYRQALHLAYQSNERDSIVSALVDVARLLTASPMHLNIADALVNDALVRDVNDREALKLKEQITAGRMQAVADDVDFKPISGKPQDYAAKAYQLLDE